MSTFLDNNGGPGVQHIAFHTDDIISTTAKLRKQGLSVIQPPMEYYSLPVSVRYIINYCILHGRIKGYNSFITTIMCQGDSYRTVVE